MKHTTPDLMKFKKLQRRLGVHKAQLVGMLELLWIATQKSAPRGDIGKFDDEEIAIEMGWDGDPETLILSLVECGWLDRCEDHRLVVHDWHEHAPRYLKGNISKAGGFVSGPSKDSPYGTPVRDPRTEEPSEDTGDPVRGSHTDHPPNLTKPNQTKPNLTKPNLTNGGGSEPKDGSKQPPPARLAKFEFPVDGNPKVKTWKVPPDFAKVLEEAYPSLDIEQEILQAKAWVVANPTRRKTAGGMQGFLRNWLAKSQNRGSPPSRNAPRKIPSAKEILAMGGSSGDD